MLTDNLYSKNVSLILIISEVYEPLEESLIYVFLHLKYTWMVFSQVKDTYYVSRLVIGVWGKKKGHTLLLLLKEFAF